MPTDLRAQLQRSLGDAYSIETELGGGNMSRVFLATETRFARQVVVKVLAPDLVAELSIDRFEREMQLAAQLQQANVVPVLRAGDCDGLPYYIMPFVDGESLRTRLQHGQLRMGEAVAVLRDVARALAYAHDRGIVHRDIKPENILLSGSAAVVTDFGIAKALHSANAGKPPVPLTMSGTSLGTPAYMAPEQVVGDEVDARADVYAWGVVAYEILAGRHPFHRRTTAQEFATAHLTETPSSLRVVSADASSALSVLVMQCLQKDPQDRPANGMVLLRMLDDLPAHILPTRPRRPALGAIVFVMALAAVTYISRGRLIHVLEQRAAGTPGDKSIAVLPFVNMSSDKDQDYFSDGITEELINSLAKSNDLRVAARTSTFRFKDGKTDVRDVARQLNVLYVLEGSVRKQGNTIRVTAQLIKAADGFQLWSESYDRTLNDIFAVQDDICARAVRALQATLLGTARVASARPRSSNAYNLVLQGRHFLADRDQQGVERAIGYFQRALALDSSDAPAWSGLARAYTVQAGQGWIPVADGYGRSRRAALKAIALDPQLGEAYAALGYIQNTVDWAWGAADSSYRRALALEPGNAESLRAAALLSAKLGRFDDAIRGLQQAIDRDPLLAGAYSGLAFMLDATGRSAEAEVAARKALDLGPNGILRHFNIARALVLQDKASAALREVQLEKGESWRQMGLAIVYHALHRKGDSDHALAEYTAQNASHAAMQIADIYAYRGDTNGAFEWLQRAYDQRDAGIADMKDDPWLKNVRGDARYHALLRKVGLPE